MKKDVKSLRAKYKARKPKRMAQMQWYTNLDYSNSRPIMGPGSRGGKRGRRPPEASFSSHDGRWYVRPGNYSTMILTDRRSNKTHVVQGTTLPEVEDKIAEILAEETR